MLIEAARGGHTSVVNLLLRQPLMKRRQLLDQANANDSRKLAMSAARNKHTTSVAPPSSNTTPAVNNNNSGSNGSTSNAASSSGNQTGKTLSSTSTLQHISPPEQGQVQDTVTPTPATTGSASMTGLQQPQLAGSSGNGGGNSAGLGHLQHHAKTKVVQKLGGKQQLQGQGNNAEREAGSYPQQQQLISDSTDKGITSSSRKGGGDLIGAKRPKMSSTELPSSSGTQSALMTTPTKQPNLVDSDLSYLVTPPPTSAATPAVISSAFSPGHYTTDSATALKNMQRLTSNANSPLKSGVIASEVGTSVDMPPLLHSQAPHMVNSAHMNSNEVTLPSTQLTPDDIIQGHMTADDIIARYWRQQNISEVSSKHSSGSVNDSKANGTKDSMVESAAQRMFSSGNFSTLPPHPTSSGQAGYHTSRFHASSSAMGIPPGGGDPPSLLVNSMSTGEHNNSATTGNSDSSNINQAPSVDSHPLSNVDLTRLIPHLEALAGSLQNPTSLESHQYLAALAAQSHLIHPPPVLTDDNNIDVPPDIGVDEKISLPASIGSLDPSALLSAAEIAKLLPNLAGFESQSDSDDYRAVTSSADSTTGPSHMQPIYPASLSTLRHLSQKLQGYTPSSEMGPDPGGGGGVIMGVAGVGSEEEGSDIDVDLLHQDPVRSLPQSLLLDSKFPLDIPPPNDLIPPENVSIKLTHVHVQCKHVTVEPCISECMHAFHRLSFFGRFKIVFEEP